MTTEQFKVLAKKLKLAYQRDRFLADKETTGLWFEMLNDLDEALAAEAVEAHIKTSQYPPTIADIRKRCKDIQEEESRLRNEMREIFEFSKGVYPSSQIEKDTMAYWNTLTADSSWSMRVEKAKALQADIVAFVRHAELTGSIDEIPTFTGYLKGLVDGLRS